MNRDADYHTKGQRCLRIWTLLWGCALTRDRITYLELSQLADVHLLLLAQGDNNLLRNIRDYCLRYDLPPLDSQVISRDTGAPGPGYPGDAAADLARVRGFLGWEAIPHPAAEDFQ